MEYDILIDKFLIESDKANKEAFRLSMAGTLRYVWDLAAIIVSGKMEEEAALYMLKLRAEDHILPSWNFEVLDVKEMSSQDIARNLFARSTDYGQKTLIIDASGEDGVVRLFRPLPRLLSDVRFSTLFDERMILASMLAPRLPGGVLTMGGNMLSIFNPLQIEVSSSEIAYPVVRCESPKGVMLTDIGITWMGTEFLRKLPQGEAQALLCKNILSGNRAYEQMRPIPLCPAYAVEAEQSAESSQGKCLGFGEIPACPATLSLSNAYAWERDYRVERFIKEAIGGNPGAAVWLGIGGMRKTCVDMVLEQIKAGEQSMHSDAMHLYAFLSDEPSRAEECIEHCFSILKEQSVHLPYEEPITEFKQSKVLIDLPVRVNWAGTWSDAPPYCYERGGTMLNAAVTLDGKRPIRVTARILDYPGIVLESVDLGVKKDFGTDIGELLSCDNTSDAFALHKAALYVSGVISKGLTEENLRERLKKTGGLEIISKVDLPHGSGLGGSSILAGGLVTAIERLIGRKSETDVLMDKVLILEQMVTSGGGWQDQIGGLIPGVKLTTTQPGIPQCFEITKIKLSHNIKDELNQRMFFLYTGQRRLAKHILRKVVLRYLKAEPDILCALNESRRNAEIMKVALEGGQLREFAELVNRHHELAKIIDPSTTNVWIDHIFEVCKPHAEALTICGAGGGGFAFGLLRSGEDIEAAGRSIDKIYQGVGVRVASCRLVE